MLAAAVDPPPPLSLDSRGPRVWGCLMPSDTGVNEGVVMSNGRVLLAAPQQIKENRIWEMGNVHGALVGVGNRRVVVEAPPKGSRRP
jgi:hypothetical protein